KASGSAALAPRMRRGLSNGSISCAPVARITHLRMHFTPYHQQLGIPARGSLLPLRANCAAAASTPAPPSIVALEKLLGTHQPQQPRTEQQQRLHRRKHVGNPRWGPQTSTQTISFVWGGGYAPLPQPPNWLALRVCGVKVSRQK